MAALYERLLPLIPPGASILDAGCESGRDAAFFKQKGYVVTAMDVSEELCALASAHLSQDEHCLRFDEIARQGQRSKLQHGWLTEDQRPDRDERWLNALVWLKRS